MEPNTTPQAERLLSFTQVCRRAAQGLYHLLDQIEREPESARELAKLRGLFCTRFGPGAEAVEVIDPQHHRAHLDPCHPMALAEDDPARREPLVCVGAFDPLAHLLGLPEPTRAVPNGWDLDPHVVYGIERRGLVYERIAFGRSVTGEPLVVLNGDGVEVEDGGVHITVKAELVEHVIHEGQRRERESQ